VNQFEKDKEYLWEVYDFGKNSSKEVVGRVNPDMKNILMDSEIV